MTQWLSSSPETLRTLVETSTGKLLLCSPYVSRPGLEMVTDALPSDVSQIEIWTKLEPHDWLTGASDYEGLLDFIQEINSNVSDVSMRHASNLHAKIVVSDGPYGLAGSANLTAGGFGGNLEVVGLTQQSDLNRLRNFVERMRPRLTPITFDQFMEFVAQCVAKVDSQEALLALIREEMPPQDFGPQPLVSYIDFLDYLEGYQSSQANEILTIARNIDGNNNTGKVKQAFYGIQRFLQEYPGHVNRISGLPDNEWFDVSSDPILEDWKRFLTEFATEENLDYRYSIPTLKRYLPLGSGGSLMGGGGGDNQLKRVWPYVGRIVESHRPQ